MIWYFRSTKRNNCGGAHEFNNMKEVDVFIRNSFNVTVGKSQILGG
jgi:hypothetical protein